MKRDLFKPPRLLPTKLLLACSRRSTPQFVDALVRDHLRKWCLDEEITIYSEHGFKIKASPRDYSGYGICFFGEYEASMSHVLGCFVREGQTVWDVGAERGWFTLLMASLVGSEGRIDSFEAFPSNAEKVKANVALNDYTWVHVNGAAVSSQAGKMWFVPPTSKALIKTTFYLHRGVGYLADKQTEDAIEVPSLALDEYAEQTGVQSLSIIKMDIEGAEVAALKGAKQSLDRWKPMLMIEYNQVTARRAGSSTEELDDLLDSYGYDRMLFTDRFTRLDIKGAHKDLMVYNVYCFHRSSGMRPSGMRT